MTMPVLDIFGYDDAVAGRTRLVSDSPRWAQDMRSEFADADRAGDVTTVWRSAAAKGIELEPKQIAGMKNWNGLRERAMKSEKALLKEAPLVYVTPGVATRLAEYSSVVPDVHVLPFAEPVILWFATALEGDWEPTRTKDVRVKVPIRAALVVPSQDLKRIFLTSYAYYPDMAAMGMHIKGYGTTPMMNKKDRDNFIKDHGTPHWGMYCPDTIAVITAGKDASKISNVTALVARALNSMSAKEVRMLESDTENKITTKEAKRAGVERPGEVHVIYLPREKKNTAHVPTDGGTGSRRRHRVRAHWRRQPYGPRGAGQWRWTRVESHERGTGAMVGSDTVYVTRGNDEKDD